MPMGSISSDMLHLRLKQLGASKIHSNISRVMVVKFEINENLNVSYFLHVKDEEKIYIQRIEPYPVRNYRFETIDNIISFIQKDVELFRNASNSHNFDLFLDMITKNFEVRKEVEEFFLSNNVPAEVLAKFVEREAGLLDEIIHSDHVKLNADIEAYHGNEAKQKNSLEERIDKEKKPGKYVKDIYGEADIVQPAVLNNMIGDLIENKFEESKRALKEELVKELTDEVTAKVLKRLKK